MAQAAKAEHCDWWPENRLIAQWARHVQKLRRELDGGSAGATPPRLVFEARDVSRFITVTDGDGFMAVGLRMRLLGIDAPEIDQSCWDDKGKDWPCGKRARRRLVELLRSGRVEIFLHQVDIYGRFLVTCLANGKDVNETLVREGLAIAYCDDRYREAEQEACRHRRGIWRGSFEEPASWRRSQNSHCGCKGRKAPPAHASAERNGQVPHISEEGKDARQRPQIHAATEIRKNIAASSPAEGKRHPDQPEWDRLSEAMHDLLARLKVVRNASRADLK